ncbi:HD domain-containing phosphohydrolase [Celerinatantimonas sp. YJH-8]|uniref:HD domain-containing phosphohydrolase n=1 Tax=Celerinatantimonas sp. YJH-8 TaxID=3228714 RepID=UPI0038C299E6
MFKHRSIRLQILISLIISSSMLIIATILITQSYLSRRATSIQQTQDQSRQLAQRITTKIDQDNQMLMNSMQLLISDPIFSITQPSQRYSRLPVLSTLLALNPITSAVYIGYPNGDFLLLRHHPQSATHTAPYQLQIITRAPDGTITHASWQDYDPNKSPSKAILQPHYRFDPRTRNWFQLAEKSQGFIITPPYRFFTTQEIGISFALKAPSGAILGTDASLADVSRMLAQLRPSPETELALVNQTHQLIGSSDITALHLQHTPTNSLIQLAQLNRPELVQIAENDQTKQFNIYQTQQQNWYGLKMTSTPLYFHHWNLLIAIPEYQIMASALAGLKTQLVTSIFLTLILILIGWQFGHRIAAPLEQLNQKIMQMSAFDFNHHLSSKSSIKEFQQLASLINKMASSILHFQSISQILASENKPQQMLTRVSYHLTQITHAQEGLVYRYEAQRNVLLLTQQTQLPVPKEIPLNAVVPDDIPRYLSTFFTDIQQQLFITPLLGRQQQLLGVFVLQMKDTNLNRGHIFKKFVAMTSGSAALAIETQQQIESQAQLINAIMQLLADAIDTKSPYTGGHCRRVPILSEMILNAIEMDHAGKYADFKLSQPERQEFMIAAWLHDCGKIIMPEHIIDKATKLETIYNRIHEIRARFEILWRDEEIKYWQQLSKNPARKTQLTTQLKKRHQQLQRQFALVAQLNLSAEKSNPEQIKQLHHIAKQTWERHFDRRLGLSPTELKRLSTPEPTLPASEFLISDRIEHLIPWPASEPPVRKNDPKNRWGFDMELPQYNYNLGELYNLSIRYGTLTREDRFIINNHIVQTIRMLSSLPLPQSMQRIPDLAGNHHEKLNGSGYPRKLNASQLTVPERIIALADIFEALTASDRPYHTNKSLSEALSIMAKMVRSNALDRDLFQHFVTQHIYLDYAHQFLKPQQIDPVDEAMLLQF